MQPDYNRPAWTNPLDEDLDWMRDNQNFLLCLCASGTPIIPGWRTTVDISSTGNYAKPDGYALRKGTRAIYVNLVWTDKTYTNVSPNVTRSLITQVTLGYDNGVSSPSVTWFDPVTLTIEGAGSYTTTAKHFGDGSSPSNYYQTGGGTLNSPIDWGGLIPSTGGSEYDKMTLVFCVYPVALGDADSWYIFGSESGNIIVGNWDLDGGIWIGARSWKNLTKSVNVVPTGSPSDYGGLIPGQWNTVMIAYNGDSASSPQTRNVEIWANGVEIYNGTWGTVAGDAQNNPTSYAGYSWVGRGDGFSGATDDGMNCYLAYVWCKEEYLSPTTYWSSFFDGSNKPLDIGADGSSVTGAAPDTFCPGADFTNNLGTGPNWTEIGTVPAAPSSPTD